MMVQPRPATVIGEGGLRLNVWDYGGPGPDLLLCHCTGTLGRTWDPVAARLGGAFRLLAIDTRGHGDSDTPEDRSQFEWRLSGEDVSAVVEHFDLAEPRFACGHSAGGAHLAYAQLAQPGLFSKLALIDPIIAHYQEFGVQNPLADKVRRRINAFPSRQAARERFAAKPPMSLWAPEALDAYLEHAFLEAPGGGITLKCPGDREAWFYELGGAHDVYRRLGEIACPVLLLTGSDSYVAPLVEKQAARLTHGAVAVVEGAGHFIPQERPGRVAEALKEWFL